MRTSSQAHVIRRWPLCSAQLAFEVPLDCRRFGLPTVGSPSLAIDMMDVPRSYQKKFVVSNPAGRSAFRFGVPCFLAVDVRGIHPHPHPPHAPCEHPTL